MLVIRAQQLRILGEVATFHHLQARLGTLFPLHCRNLGPAGVRTAIHSAVSRARKFGFKDPEYLGFAALEFVFGPEFYKRKEYGWAARILHDQALTPAVRMQKLREASTSHLSKLAEG